MKQWSVETFVAAYSNLVKHSDFLILLKEIAKICNLCSESCVEKTLMTKL